jgi:hypothetical protein
MLHFNFFCMSFEKNKNLLGYDNWKTIITLNIKTQIIQVCEKMIDIRV